MTRDLQSRNVLVPFAALLLMFALCLFHVDFSHALSVSSSELNLGTDCSITQAASFTGMLPVPPDTYDVYARLPSVGQTTDVQVYGEVNNGKDTCQPIGSVQATGDGWTLVGTWVEPSTSSQTIFDLASNNLSNQLDANRPAIMLISQTHPTCQPTSECYVTIDGERGEVQPIGTLPNEDSLHIVRPIDPSQDTVQKVTYYVDDEPMYTTPTLKPFDMRYVTYQNQSLARVIEYASGQRVVLNETVPDTFQDTFWNLLFRIFRSNPELIFGIGGIVALSVIGGAIVALIHGLNKRKDWRLAHGLIKEKQRVVTSADRRKAFYRERRTRYFRRSLFIGIGLVALFTLVVFINSYVIQIYKVDGVSMEKAYPNGSTQLINKVPVTLAHLAGHDYTPKRGQVVIIRQVFGITDDLQAADKENQYLIKRVIGLPGERVVVHAGVITIYNAQYPNGFNPDAGTSWQKTGYADPDGPDVDVTLAKDEIFIAGDNRPESIDSRFNGPILTEQIVGLVDL